MSYSPTDRIISKGVGFKVYGPSGEVASSGDTDTFGKVDAIFVPVPGARYTLQAYNYVRGVEITYTIAGAGGATAVVPLPAP